MQWVLLAIILPLLVMGSIAMTGMVILWMPGRSWMFVLPVTLLATGLAIWRLGWIAGLFVFFLSNGLVLRLRQLLWFLGRRTRRMGRQH